MEVMDLENGPSTMESQQHGRWMKKRDDDQAVDGPEALVRGDTRAVNLLRSFVIVGLVVATVLTGVATHKLLTRIELHSFMSDFKAVSTSFVQTFMDDLNLKMWQANSLSVSITGADTLHYSVPYFAELVKGPQAITYASVMVYSPLLHDEAERRTWESYAHGVIGMSNQDESNLCFVCGGQDLSVGATENIIQLPSYPPFSCGVIQTAGLQGLISRGQCPEAQQIVQTACNCQWKSNNATGSQLDVSNVTDIFHLVDGAPVVSKGPRPYSPIWQVSGLKQSPVNMFDQMSDPVRREAISAAVGSKGAVLSRTKFEAGDFEKVAGLATLTNGLPKYSIFYPIFEGIDGKNVIGTLGFDFSWNFFSTKVLPVGSEGIELVVENTCGQVFTYSVGADLTFIYKGVGDLHDPTFDSMEQQSSFDDFSKLQVYSSLLGEPSEDGGCKYRVLVYPSTSFQSRYYTSTPTIVTVIVVVIFLFTSSVFFAYDRLVRRLQSKVMRSAVKYNSMLASLFPATVRSRLFNSQGQTLETDTSSDEFRSERQQKKTFLPRLMETPKLQIKNFLANTSATNENPESIYDEPIADLFPHTTVFFADIAGFTAWSSEREPSHVFKLLETLYSAFDRIAAKLGVFKVETVGDCYVAVTGLPEPNEHHAVIMALFARECLSSMSELTRSLESTLGPSTASLALRVGMHSGPVIAGVLRGEKSRFQLFGDTMNTASRMESNGVINKIQVSQTTADLLTEAGKADWVVQRDDLVAVKGKGEMQTFWVYPQEPSLAEDPLHPISERHPTPSPFTKHEVMWGFTDGEAPTFGVGTKGLDNVEQLVDWNVSLLSSHLQKIVARRRAVSHSSQRRRRKSMAKDSTTTEGAVESNLFEASHPRDEVVDMVAMPEFSAIAVKHYLDPASVRLPVGVSQQLRSYVERIAAAYRSDNAFHNFEHASHVAMSSSKLMKRIIAPDGVDYNQRSIQKAKRLQAVAKEIHDTTFGISSDPLLQFAAVFSALIHDVDHEGVPNNRLSQEMSPTAVKYDHKSVAEQHSIQVAWSVFMEDQYSDLRSFICESEAELLRFRQLVVNAVIATDIADKSLQSWRQEQWDQAFHSPNQDAETLNRRATIVYAYILQASDVAHTMQHWHTYRKWNERLFEERYHEYEQGRTDEDPSLTWYDNELYFFDEYIIPLARKLDECGVFGVSSWEYMSHALENRQEWASKGRAIVQDLIMKGNHHHRLYEYSQRTTSPEATPVAA
jgi:class 3 adenylate cyclase